MRKEKVIPNGTPVCSIRLTQNRDELAGIFYIPVDKGNRVEQGMTFHLAQNGIDTSQAGSLIGVVLGNDQLAQCIQSTQNSALMEIKFDLVKDKNSKSGYLWTSIIGEHKEITAGKGTDDFTNGGSRMRRGVNQLIIHWDMNIQVQQTKGKWLSTAVNGLTMIETIKANGNEGDFFAKWTDYHLKLQSAHKKFK